MGNPLMSLMGATGSGNMIQQFIKFKNEFQGDPTQALNEMVKSGKYSQEQINQATQMANQIAPMLKGLIK